MGAHLIVLETARTRLRLLTAEDAQFILEILSDPSFIRNIGDRGVRTLQQAGDYIRTRIVDSYERHGFGMWGVERKADSVLMGMSGLVKRDELEDVDLGFAFLPEYRGCGYAEESALAVCRYSFDVLGLRRLVAITVPGNARSIALLEKLGLRFERTITLGEEDTPLRLYATERPV